MPKSDQRKQRLLVGWAYGVELLAASCLHLMLGMAFGAGPLVAFVHRSARDWAALEGVLLAAALVIWGIYFNFMASDFGDYLRWDGGERVFRAAFTFAVFIQLLAAVLMIVVANLPTEGSPPTLQSNSGYLVHLSFLVLLLALINIRTLFNNTRVLLHLRQSFLKDKKVAEDEMRQPRTPRK